MEFLFLILFVFPFSSDLLSQTTRAAAGHVSLARADKPLTITPPSPAPT